jgi:NAD(P)-dependent dehydrogenase (short-subunit alcohol dehydrogenase family)
MQSFLDVDREAFDLMMAVNCRATMQISQIVARALIAEAKSDGGAAAARASIVHVSSQSSTVGIRQRCAYSLSKAGVDYLTKAMALELGPHGIRTNCVNPTVVLTPLGREAWKDPKKAAPMKASIPLGRFADPRDIADATLFLLSDAAAMINGVVLPVDGGFLATKAHLP